MIELMLVLAMLGIMLAVAAPSLGRFGRGSKLRDAGQQLLAATRYARSAAITQATTWTLTISDNTYTIAPDENAASGATAESFRILPEYQQPTTLPPGMSVKLVSGGENGVVTFNAVGRCTPAAIEVSNEQGDVVRIESAAAAEPFKRTSGSGT